MRSRTVDVTTKLPPLLDCRLMVCEKNRGQTGMNDGWFNRRARNDFTHISPSAHFSRDQRSNIDAVPHCRCYDEASAAFRLSIDGV